MNEVLGLALSFPSVVFTVLVGVVLIYWAFVMVGVVHIGEGSEGALDGHGHVDAGGGHEVDFGGHGHAHGFGDAGDAGDAGDVDVDEVPGAITAMMNALHLRAVPLTVVVSLIVIFSWLVSVTIMQVVTRSFPVLQGVLLNAAVFAVAPILALPFTSLAARPLAPLFRTRKGTAKSSLIGKTCVVRTGSVTEKLGEATLEDGGAGLVIRVRVEDGKKLGRGEQALIVDWDAERETFLVEPMRDVMDAKH